jgi:hypothetical protein
MVALDRKRPDSKPAQCWWIDCSAPDPSARGEVAIERVSDDVADGSVLASGELLQGVQGVVVDRHGVHFLTAYVAGV